LGVHPTDSKELVFHTLQLVEEKEQNGREQDELAVSCACFFNAA
jgi:hypothetical protein